MQICRASYIFKSSFTDSGFSNTAKLGLFKNGYIGVDFFFVLSGFLMVRHVSINHSDNMDLVNIADGTWHEAVNLDVILKICNALDCDVYDVLEIR